METSSAWNPLGQRTRSEEQILFLKFSGANVGGHGRLSKCANILERIKLSRIGLANVFSPTISMSTDEKIKILKNKIARFYFSEWERKYLSSGEYYISQILKISILRTKKKREFLGNTYLPSSKFAKIYIKKRTATWQVIRVSLKISCHTLSMIRKFSSIPTFERSPNETCFRKTKPRVRTNKAAETPSFRLRSIFTSETRTLRV